MEAYVGPCHFPFHFPKVLAVLFKSSVKVITSVKVMLYNIRSPLYFRRGTVFRVRNFYTIPKHFFFWVLFLSSKKFKKSSKI